jgi:hypothetical protein
MASVKWEMATGDTNPLTFLSQQGTTADVESESDVVMLVQGYCGQIDPSITYKVIAEITPNLSTIDAQIDALLSAGTTQVLGDSQPGSGFSLKWTVLAYAARPLQQRALLLIRYARAFSGPKGAAGSATHSY